MYHNRMMPFSQQQKNNFYSFDISNEIKKLFSSNNSTNYNYNNHEKIDANMNNYSNIYQRTTRSTRCEFSRLLLSSSSINEKCNINSISSNDNNNDRNKINVSILSGEANNSQKNFKNSELIKNNYSKVKKKFSPLLTSTNVKSGFLKLLQEPTTPSSTMNKNIYNQAIELNQVLCDIGEDNCYLSEFEAQILKSTNPLSIEDDGLFKIELNDNLSGVWINKQESDRWNGEIPLNQYQINKDDDPCIITKTPNTKLKYIQEMAVRYLQPPTPPLPGDIVIEQEPNMLIPPAPPLVIRQAPARPMTPEPLIIREKPPTPPPLLGKKVITIHGKNLPPPPRKVVIERFAPLPPKPQSVIIERWLPFKQQKRRVVLKKNPESDPVCSKPKNYIIQWEPPKVEVTRKVTYLPVIKADPNDYLKQYGSSLMHASQMPFEVLSIKNPKGIVLAAEIENKNILHELEGDIDALKLIDLDAEGLGEYKDYLKLKSSSNLKNFDISSPIDGTISTPPSNLTSISNLSSALNNNKQESNHIYKNKKSIDSVLTPPSTISRHNTSILETNSPYITLDNRSVVGEVNLLLAIDEIFSLRQKKGYITYQETLDLLSRLDKSIGKNLGESSIKLMLNVMKNRDGLIDSKTFKFCFQKVLL